MGSTTLCSEKHTFKRTAVQLIYVPKTDLNVWVLTTDDTNFFDIQMLENPLTKA